MAEENKWRRDDEEEEEEEEVDETVSLSALIDQCRKLILIRLTKVQKML